MQLSFYQTEVQDFPLSQHPQYSITMQDSETIFNLPLRINHHTELQQSPQRARYTRGQSRSLETSDHWPLQHKGKRACSSKPSAINSCLTLRSSLGTWRFSPMVAWQHPRPCWAAQVWAAGLGNSNGLSSEAGARQSTGKGSPSRYRTSKEQLPRQKVKPLAASYSW